MQYLFVRVDKSYALLRIMRVADWNYLIFPAARAAPLPHRTGSVPHALPVGLALDHAMMPPVLRLFPSFMHAAQYRDAISACFLRSLRLIQRPSRKPRWVGFAHIHFRVCTMLTHVGLYARQVPIGPSLYTEGFNRFVNPNIS
jgi:hypothetical protein